MTSIDKASSPWNTVFGLIRDQEDGCALMALWEYQDRELLANGRPISDLLDVAIPSERAVAERIAIRLRELVGGNWEYTDFYSPTRGDPAPTHADLQAFVDRCRGAGVRLHYADGVDAP